MDKFQIFENDQCNIGLSCSVKSSLLFQTFCDCIRSIDKSYKLDARSFAQWIRLNRPQYVSKRRSDGVHIHGITLKDVDKCNLVETKFVQSHRITNRKYYKETVKPSLNILPTNRGKRSEFLVRSGMTLTMYKEYLKQKVIKWIYHSNGDVDWEQTLLQTRTVITQYDSTMTERKETKDQESIVKAINGKLKFAVKYEKGRLASRRNFVLNVRRREWKLAKAILKTMALYLRRANKARVKATELRAKLRPTIPQPKEHPPPEPVESTREFPFLPNKPIIPEDKKKFTLTERDTIRDWYNDTDKTLREIYDKYLNDADQWKLANILYEFHIEHNYVFKRI